MLSSGLMLVTSWWSGPCASVAAYPPGDIRAARRASSWISASGAHGARSNSADVPGFDELIHAPNRLSIVALLAASQWAEFTFVRDSLGMSDSALSKQISARRRGYEAAPPSG